MDFEWDDTKNALNRSRHNIDFRDALAVFFDDHAVVREDHSRHNEMRMHICGKSCVGLLLVVYTEIVEDMIRVISARKAEKPERKAYERGYF